MPHATSLIRTALEDDLPAILDLYAQTGLDDGVRLDLSQARELFAQFARYPWYRCSSSSTHAAP